MKKNYFLLAVAAISMAGCSNDESMNTAEFLETIGFSASIGDVTRAATTDDDLQATYFKTGEEVKIGITSGTPVYAVYTAKAHASNTNEFEIKSGETALKWPASGTVDLQAFHPSTVTAASTTFDVQPDQSDPDDYRLSDLMISDKKSGVAKTTAKQTFTFAHQLSKIVVNLSNTDGSLKAADLANTTVEIYAIKTAKLASGAWTADTDVSADWITLGTGASVTGIVPPQERTYTAPTAINFIRIKVRDNDAKILTVSATKTFLANTVHTYNIKVNMSAISLESTEITGWDTTVPADNLDDVII